MIVKQIVYVLLWSAVCYPVIGCSTDSDSKTSKKQIDALFIFKFTESRYLFYFVRFSCLCRLWVDRFWVRLIRYETHFEIE